MAVDEHFLQISLTPESHSKRYFIFFKPKDIVVDENFKIVVSLNNQTDREFPGCVLYVRHEFDENTSSGKEKEYSGIEIPKIPPKTKIEVKSPFFMKSPHSGTNYISIRNLPANDNKKIIFFPPKTGFALNLDEHHFPFHVSPKEEIYQYYGVWFAVALSLVAIGLSAIDGIISILQFLGLVQ